MTSRAPRSRAKAIMRTRRIFREWRRGDVAACSRLARRIIPAVESMDGRLLLSAGAASVARARTGLDMLSVSSAEPSGYSPAQIRAAYGIDAISFANGTIDGDGAGQTIAIIEADADPHIASDLATFDAEYGLPAPPSFTVFSRGATRINAGWALETALDVEWAHAIAPEANIVLVEASGSSATALFRAVRYARKLPGVSVVSMSWGTSEFARERSYDSLFTTPSGHTNVTYVAASGDSGAESGPIYPASSPNVMAVGGTRLLLSASGSYIWEAAWPDSTGGISRFEPEPSYQVATLASSGLSTTKRATPDVAFDADPSTGYSVYSSVSDDGQSGWFDVGGTSAGAQAWAGLVAIADQGRATVGQGTLSTGTLLDELYSLPASDLNAIRSRSIGYAPTTGYDLVTGLGTPRANMVIASLVADARSS